jgi:hypothetical protein
VRFADASITYPKKRVLVMNANVIVRKLDLLEGKGGMRSIDVANVLGTQPQTVSLWRQGKAFPRSDAQHMLLDLEYIVEQLADYYEPQEARLWLFSRQKLLGRAIPAELIQQGRAQDVIAVIDQLCDSVLI